VIYVKRLTPASGNNGAVWICCQGTGCSIDETTYGAFKLSDLYDSVQLLYRSDTNAWYILSAVLTNATISQHYVSCGP